MMFTPVFVIMLVARYCTRANSMQNSYFARKPLLDNHSCAVEDILFAKNEVRGSIKCAALCDGNPLCRSFFFSKNGLECRGCRKAYMAMLASVASVTLPDAVGFTFYRMKNGNASSCKYWSPLEDSCYWITNIASDYTNGKVLCKAVGGYPVMFETQTENDYLKQQLTNAGSGMVYIGLVEQSHGVWVWDKTQTALTFQEWALNEPYNCYPCIEQCVGMVPTTSSSWIDLGCGVSLPMLCELNV